MAQRVIGMCKKFLFSIFSKLPQIALATILVLFMQPDTEARAKQSNGEDGDWSIICDTPPGARREQCAIIQSVIAENQQDIGLAVSVLRTADGRKQLLRVVTSLGVWIPAGLNLRIDDEVIMQIKYERCIASGCFAEIELQPNLQEKLKKGNLATFIIFRTPEQGIGLPISLDGFEHAFNQVHKRDKK